LSVVWPQSPRADHSPRDWIRLRPRGLRRWPDAGAV